MNYHNGETAICDWCLKDFPLRDMLSDGTALMCQSCKHKFMEAPNRPDEGVYVGRIPGTTKRDEKPNSEAVPPPIK